MPTKEWDEPRYVARGMLIIIGVSACTAHAVDSASDESSAQIANVNEIVVSVQKRVERIQNIPIPVRALEASALVDRHSLRVQDYPSSAPRPEFRFVR